VSRLTSRPRLLLAIAIGLAALLVAETAVLAVTTIKTGGPVRSVKVATETAQQTIYPGGWADVQGMSLSMTVPSGEKALLLITFSSASFCHDSSGASAFCGVRILVDGIPALPDQVTFDSARTDGNIDSSHEPHSMQFVAGPLNAGQHTIKVQGAVSENPSYFGISTRTLSVLRSRV
jgi:hypothetical protein